MIDAYTETWRDIAKRANEIIDQSRDRLEHNDQTYGESQFLRGRISAMRELLSMAVPKVVASNPTPHELRPKDRSGV